MRASCISDTSVHISQHGGVPTLGLDRFCRRTHQDVSFWGPSLSHISLETRQLAHASFLGLHSACEERIGSATSFEAKHQTWQSSEGEWAASWGPGQRSSQQKIKDQNLLHQPLRRCTRPNNHNDSWTGWDWKGFCSWNEADHQHQGICVTLNDTFIRNAKFEDGLALEKEAWAGGNYCLSAWAFAAVAKRDPGGIDGLEIQCEQSNENIWNYLKDNAILFGPSKSYDTVAASKKLAEECSEDAIAQKLQLAYDQQRIETERQHCLSRKDARWNDTTNTCEEGKRSWLGFGKWEPGKNQEATTSEATGQIRR